MNNTLKEVLVWAVLVACAVAFLPFFMIVAFFGALVGGIEDI